MNKIWKERTTCALVASTLLIGIAVATTGIKNIEAVYTDIKLVVDSVAVTPTDAKGSHLG